MSGQNSIINERPEPIDGRKLAILFLCTGNTCRSQMAENAATEEEAMDHYRRVRDESKPLWKNSRMF